MIRVVASLSTGGIHVTAESAVTIPHKFTSDYRLCKVESGNSFKLAYMDDRWEWFNQHCFGGVMDKPHFTISNKQRSLGIWYPGRRTIELGKRMFQLGSEGQVLGTFLHEMCHQYVDEILKDWKDGIGTGGHGPVWQSVMVAVGLPPDRNFEHHPDHITPTQKLEQKQEKRELLQRHEKPEAINDDYRVMRYIHPAKNIDCPVLVHPQPWYKGTLFVVADLWTSSEKVKSNQEVYIEYLRIPGPLKIKTPLYRFLQHKADRLNEMLEQKNQEVEKKFKES